MTALSRRDVLKAGSVLLVTFPAAALIPEWAHAQTGPASAPPPAAGKPLDPADVDSFLAIHADSTVTIYTGKVDVGTGLRVAVAQMAAEELGVRAEAVHVVDGDTGVCPDQGGTGG